MQVKEETGMRRRRSARMLMCPGGAWGQGVQLLLLLLLLQV